MSAASLNLLLTRHTRRGDGAELAAAWRHDDLAITLSGLAPFVAAPSLLNKVRGALGAVLLESASPGVRARRGCDWPRTCAAEPFFGRRPLVRLGDHDSELAKPFVLSASTTAAGDLVLGARIFGLARRWTPVIAEALPRVAREKLRWDLLARDAPALKPLRDVVVSVRERLSVSLASAADSGGGLEIQFVTPVSCERGDLARDPKLLFASLARRLALLAPWHGFEPASILAAATVDLADLAAPIVGPDLPKAVAQGGHHMRNRVGNPPKLSLPAIGNQSLQWLRMGEFAHIGRGASLGLGAMRISKASARVDCDGLPVA